jgi:hypothetical protein
MSTNLSELPATAAQWDRQIVHAGVEGLSIFHLANHNSGSNITHAQFLLLRVLWHKEDQNVFSRTAKSWVPDDEYEKAKRLLKAKRFWHRYLKSFEQTAAQLSGKPLPDDLGTFSLVRDSQCEVERIDDDNSSESPKFSPIAHRTRGRAALKNPLQAPSTPTPIRTAANPIQNDPYLTPDVLRVVDHMAEFGISDSPFPPQSSAAVRSDILSPCSPAGPEAAACFPPTKDEQIVNSALLLFLKAVTVHFVGEANWSVQRKAFHVANKGDKIFEARVDGVLLRRSDHQIMAILEVKPCIRGKKEADIQRQESAQMAAWISSEGEASTEAGVPIT